LEKPKNPRKIWGFAQAVIEIVFVSATFWRDRRHARRFAAKRALGPIYPLILAPPIS
jgi:hypothetical protein